jgi:hypothetical protein
MGAERVPSVPIILLRYSKEKYMTTFGDQVFQWGGMPVGSFGTMPLPGGRAWYVDGDNGAAGNTGKSPADAKATVTAALAVASTGDVIFVFPRKMLATSSDPVSYAETVTITVPQVSIVGIGNGRVQGGLPQFKIGAGTTPMFDIKAPGVRIANLGINGASSTGGGIKITDDGGTASAVIGTTIEGCHFKNCKCHATHGSAGGAIYWGSQGGGWQTTIRGNQFYKNVGDIVLVGTSLTVPQDILIEDNIFSGPAADVDVNIFGSGGSGFNGLIIRNNEFVCFPALASGDVAMPVKLTGCVGVMSGNRFATSGKTFGAAANVLVPTTVFMMDNYQEAGAAQIART